MNLPNSITLSRIAAVPVLIWALSAHSPFHGAHGEQEIFASLVFIAAAVTDGLDGYLARKTRPDQPRWACCWILWLTS